MLESYLFYPIRFVCLAAIVALLLGLRLPRALVWALAGIGMAAYVAGVVLDYREARDMRDYFRKGGESLLDGRTPYENPGVMNPPTAFPFYLAFAALPEEASCVVWTLLLTLGAVVLIEMARPVLLAAGETSEFRLDAPTIALLTAVLCQSRANRFGIELGQFALLVTLCLFGAFWAAQRGRFVVAGILLAVASIKTPTMLPFLLLFFRKEDWKVWLAMGVAGLALVLTTTGPSEIVPRCRECLDNIRATRGPGKIDDYELENHKNLNMIAFSIVLSRFGIEDRNWVDRLHLAATGVLCAVVAWLVLGQRRLARPAAGAVVALFAMLFLYHRQYDLVFLALPLTYAFSRAAATSGGRRWLYVASALCMLTALNLMPWLLDPAWYYVREHDGPVSWFLRITLLPVMTWLVLASLVLLVLAEKKKGEQGV